MFSQAVKHEKPTNVRLGNRSCDDTWLGGRRRGPDEELEFLKGGTGVCDHLTTLHVLPHRKQSPPSPVVPSMWHQYAHWWTM